MLIIKKIKKINKQKLITIIKNNIFNLRKIQFNLNIIRLKNNQLSLNQKKKLVLSLIKLKFLKSNNSLVSIFNSGKNHFKLNKSRIHTKQYKSLKIKINIRLLKIIKIFKAYTLKRRKFFNFFKFKQLFLSFLKKKRYSFLVTKKEDQLKFFNRSLKKKKLTIIKPTFVKIKNLKDKTKLLNKNLIFNSKTNNIKKNKPFVSKAKNINQSNVTTPSKFKNNFNIKKNKQLSNLKQTKNKKKINPYLSINKSKYNHSLKKPQHSLLIKKPFKPLKVKTKNLVIKQLKKKSKYTFFSPSYFCYSIHKKEKIIL